jgi:hypothetical protein
MPIPMHAIRIMHRPRLAHRALLTSIGGGRFRINIDAIRALAQHAPKATGLRGYLSRSGRTLWLRPVARATDGDYHLTWHIRSGGGGTSQNPWPARVSCVFNAPALERAAGLASLRLPLEWDASAGAFRVDLPRRPIAAPTYYDRPFTIAVRLSTTRA